MIDNIKTLFARLLVENKKLVFKAIADEYNLTLVYVKQNYIWGEKIPQERQERILEITRNALIQQEEKTSSIYADTVEVIDPQEVK